MTKSITLALPAMIALLSACASTPAIPDHLLNPAAHPKFPPSAYITSVGMSERGPREAELDARARVAEQVRSEIESVTLSEIEEVTKGGSTESFQRLYSEVKSRTGFSHAEMIRVESAPAKRFEGL